MHSTPIIECDIIWVMSDEISAKKMRHPGVPFKKGEDPRRNTEGRPLGLENFKTVFEKALRKLAEKEGKDPEELYLEIVGNGLRFAKYDHKFYKDLLDRVHGTATSKSEVMVYTPDEEKVREVAESIFDENNKQREA